MKNVKYLAVLEKLKTNLNTYKKEFEVAYKAIKKASQIVMEIYHDDFTINYKEDKSVVTNADFSSENAIKEILSENFPNYAILSEEGKDNKDRLNNDYCFIVDPLDGTKDFVNKTDNFSINIALSYKNEIVLGLISVPCQNIIYYAIKGQGAYKVINNEIIKIKVSNKENDLTMLTSKFFFNDHDTYKNNPYIKEVKSIGSSYKAGLIAEGKADFCLKFDPVTKEWDTAPSEIIIKEAGGFMADIYGNQIMYNKDDVYNRNGFIIANSYKTFLKFKANN